MVRAQPEAPKGADKGTSPNGGEMVKPMPPKNLPQTSGGGGTAGISASTNPSQDGALHAAAATNTATDAGEVPAYDNSIVLAASPLADDNVNGYQTQREAARAALDNANPDSIAANLEHGGLIYRDDNTGRYHYSGPVVGGDKGVTPADAGHPIGTTVVGEYHTPRDY